MAPPSAKDGEWRSVQSTKLLAGSDDGGVSVVSPIPHPSREPAKQQRRARSSPPPSSSSSSSFGWGVIYKVRRMGRAVKQQTNRRSTKMKEEDGRVVVEEEPLVCLMEDSPFHLLKNAGRGNLEGFMKAYQRDPSRLTTEDDNGQRPLHVAVKNGHLDIVRFIIQQHDSLDSTDHKGNTALHTAAFHNQPSIAEVLLQAGADQKILNDQKMAPLHVACDLGHVEIVKVLVKEPGIDLNMKGELGKTPLHVCSIKDSAECAKVLLEHGAKPCAQCNLGYYPIHIAAKSAAAKTLEVLIQEGIKIGYERAELLSFKDKENNMPLHAAVIGGNIKAVEVCLRAGAPVNTQQDDKSTPVHFAAAQGNLAMLQMMSSMQHDHFMSALYATDAMRMSPLHRAALFNHKTVVLFLLEKGADIDSLDNTECTPLLLAASKGCWETVQVLVACGADVHVRDLNSRNFLHLAIRFGGKLEQFFTEREGTGSDDASLIQEDQPPERGEGEREKPTAKRRPSATKTLCKHRTKDLQQLLDERDKCGCTPLHYASKAGHLLALEELIKLGAAPSLKNNDKQSPFHFATRYGRYNTCRRLLDLAQGPNIMNETDSEGLTGLHIAAQNGHTKIITLLLQRGAVINKDNDNNTPLHHAASQGWTQSIRTFLTIHSHLLDVKNLYGETALHVAAKQGQVRAVSLLLTAGAAVEVDNAQKTFFDYVIELKLGEVAMAVVKHDRWEEVLMTPSSPYGSPFLGLIEHMPDVCKAVLDRCEVPSAHDKKSAEHYVEYNFKFLNMSSKCVEEAKKKGDFQPLMALNAMVRHGRVSCLSHSVCVKFLRLKWTSYGSWFYMFVLAIFGLYLASLTYFVVTYDSMRHYDTGDVDNSTRAMLWGNRKKYSEELTTLPKICIWIVVTFSVLSMIKEVLQMITQGLRYFGDAQNLNEWLLYLTSLLFSAPFIRDFSLHWQWEVGAIAVFLAWFQLLIMLQRFEFFGIYVVMFLEILRTLVQVLCVFSVLIVAFGLAFYILLHNEGSHAYSTPSLSMLRTWIMMLELDYMASFNMPYTDGDDTTLHFGGLTFFMVVIFVLFMPILLMNLLIGLAVGDIESVQRNARLKRLAGQVDMHTDMEQKMPSILLIRLQRNTHRHYPNKCQNMICSLFSRMTVSDRDELSVVEDSSTMEMRDELFKQKQKIKEMATTIEKNNELLKLILQKMEIHTEDDAWDEGMKVDRANPSACVPYLSNSPQTVRNTLSRQMLNKASIVNYMKQNKGDK